MPLRNRCNDCRGLSCRVNPKPHGDIGTNRISTYSNIPSMLCSLLLRGYCSMCSPRRKATAGDGSRCGRLQIASAEESRKMSPVSAMSPVPPLHHSHPMFPMSPISLKLPMSTTSWYWFFSGVAQPRRPQPQPFRVCSRRGRDRNWSESEAGATAR